MAWIIILVVIGFFILLVSYANKSDDKFKEEHGHSVHDLIDGGSYLSGHPLIDVPIKDCRLIFEPTELKIFRFHVYASSIEKKLITNVTIEDATTVQRRVGIKRMLLVGIFAFAWKKKVKQEMAFLIIEWTEGMFSHETIFEYEGPGSVSKANTTRNKCISWMS